MVEIYAVVSDFGNRKGSHGLHARPGEIDSEIVSVNIDGHVATNTRWVDKYANDDAYSSVIHEMEKKYVRVSINA